MTATMMLNNDLNGIEIKFDAKPAADILASLKGLGFRWHQKKKVWYAKQSEERLAVARDITNGEVAPAVAAPAKKKEKVNKYGVKVGDLFYISWGYEQTNVDFFQVIELKGEASVIVREVYPKMIEEKAVSGMSADRRYEVPEEILPAASRSTFISDNEKGVLKRISTKYYNEPHFSIGSGGHTARPYKGEEVYVSWYY